MPNDDALLRAESGREAELAALRSEIDRIDDALLALIEQRFALTDGIAAQKQAGSTLCLRPRREVEVLERLTGRSALPRDTVAALWRELMGLSVQAQQRTAITLHAPAQPIMLTNLVRQRFGSAAPIIVSERPGEALDRARTSNTIAVVELHPLSQWWIELVDDPTLVIFDGLGTPDDAIAALVIGRIAPDDLLGDISFPILTDAALRRRTDAGEPIRTLAAAGAMRLCLARGVAK